MIAPISAYDYWKLSSPYEDRECEDSDDEGTDAPCVVWDVTFWHNGKVGYQRVEDLQAFLRVLPSNWVWLAIRRDL